MAANNTTIYTDELRYYACLSRFNYEHHTICHKYEFVNAVTGVNTQAVESFNNELKLEKKRRKGVETEKRGLFLTEFCFYFNNRSNFMDAVLNLIKV
jgi:hypothetical protein